MDKPTVKTAAQMESEEDHYLEVVRLAFPSWNITPTFPGYEASPKSTMVLHAADLDSLARKLREQPS